MKRISLLLVLALSISSCVLAAKESPKNDNKIESDNRQLRVQRKKTGRSFRRKIKPKGSPKAVTDAYGNIKRRQSIVDLRELLLDDDEDDVDVQLMSDEDSQTLRMRRDDGIEDPFESWFGRDETTGHHLTMVKTTTPWGNTVTTGTMFGKNGTVYQIRTLADGSVVAEEVKQEMFDSELEGPMTDVEGDDDVDPETIDEIDGLPGGGRRGRRSLRRLDSSSQLDILVLYTKGAMCSAAGFSAGGTCAATPENLAKIEGIITLAVAETNKAYELSGIPTKLRLVKTQFDSSFNDYSNSWEVNLGNLRNNGDGQLDYVHAMRDQYGADFVSLMVDTGSFCGIGYRPLTPTAGDAFSVVQWNCATGYYSFAHEIGHNMGCNHDMPHAGGETAGSNYGYQDPSSLFRSILSYDCSPSCPRIQYFSSPNLNYNGKPLGSAKADNVAVIKNNLAAFANYRQAVPSTLITTNSPVSTPAPVVTGPTAAPSNTLSLVADLKGGYVGAAGNMIDIKATTDLYVTNFAMHATTPSIVTIEVYTKSGTCVGSQADATQWVKIGQSTFGSSAAFTPTILPEGTFAPVLVKAGTVQAFYITFTQATNLNRYSLGNAVGTVQVSNSDMQILQGYAKGYLFGPDYNPRAWNGIVYYERASSSSLTTPLQTPQPTLAPTTLPPTRAPSSLPPTRAPTTLPPTRAPTTLPPTLSPTRAPTTMPQTLPPTRALTPLPLTLPPTRAPTTPPPTRAPTTLPSTRTPTTLPPTRAPTSLPLTLLPTLAPTTLPPTRSPTSLSLTPLPTRATTTLPPTGAPATMPPTTRAPTTLPPITWAPTTLPVTGAPTSTAAPQGGVQKFVTTTFAGGNGQAGNMIEIQALKDIVVNAFDIHTFNTLSVHAYVYYMKGSYVGFETNPSAWTNIVDTWVVGKGSPNPTPIPSDKVRPVSIRAGETFSFYITLTDPSIKYTNGVVSAGDDSLKFVRSNGNKYPFGVNYVDRIWNGNLRYAPAVDAPTALPPTTTLPPTRAPTTLPPTRAPITLPPTRAPTTLPATATPTATAAPQGGVQKVVTTTFAGGNGQAGNMIEIQALKNIVVNAFDIHTYNTSSVHAYVYYMKGSYVGFETNPSAWTNIVDTWVVGKGSPNPTPIPSDKVTPVSIRAGETFSFYITLTDPSIKYTNGVVTAGDDSLKFVRSNGNKYPFGVNYVDRIWNGNLRYSPAVGTIRHLSATDESENQVVTEE